MWQPIETAPRDGTSVLVTGDKLVVVAYVHKNRWYMPHHSSTTGTELSSWIREPTHWMPLPDLPE